MNDLQRPVHIANEIMMKRSPMRPGPTLLVEGKDDRLFMERFICHQTCRIEVVEGKQNVCDVMDILNEREFPGVLGIVDADLDRVQGHRTLPDNVFMPTHHDLETMLLCSGALETVFIEFGSRCKLLSFDDRPLDAILARALPMGLLRMYSATHNLGLVFDQSDYSWVRRQDFEINIEEMAKGILNRSQRHDIPAETLVETIKEMSDAGYDPREICNGTDSLEVLAIGLMRTFGNNTPQRVNADMLRSFLRASYSNEDFNQSVLGESIREWQNQRNEYRVLREMD